MKTILCVALCTIPMSVSAAFYKCIVNGEVTYSGTPCPVEQEQNKVEIVDNGATTGISEIKARVQADEEKEDIIRSIRSEIRYRKARGEPTHAQERRIKEIELEYGKRRFIY